MNWKEGIQSIYEKHKMEKEDEWNFDVTPGKTVQVFLHRIKK